MILPALVRSLVAGPLEIDAGEMPVSEQLVQAVLNGQAILVQHILAEHDFIADTLRLQVVYVRHLHQELEGLVGVGNAEVY